MQLHSIMTAEVKVDCYSGENCDQHRKYFDMYCDGDMEGGENGEDQIVIDLAQLPPGAKITVQYPVCPECGTAREDSMQFVEGVYKIVGHPDMCQCGFDWKNWAEEEYA